MKNVFSYRWEHYRVEVCQEKELQKGITKKEVFYKIYPIREAKTLIHTLDKIEIPAFGTDGVPA